MAKYFLSLRFRGGSLALLFLSLVLLCFSGCPTPTTQTPAAQYKETVKTPSFSPAAGSYSSAQSVSIITSTSGASIYYTTDGSTPSASSNLYSSPLIISSSTMLKAIAIKGNMINSEVGLASYMIDVSKVATPVMPPAAGTYTQDCPVSIACVTADANIYYTTDGSDPSTASKSYSAPVQLGGDATAAKTFVVKAIAVKDGMKASDVVSGTYIIQYPILNIPQADPGSGSTISSGARIYLSQSDNHATGLTYTTDGSDPTTSGTAKSVSLQIYSSSSKFVISAVKPASGNILVIKAFASGLGYRCRNSGVAAFSYTVDDTVDTGIISVELK